MNEAVRPSHPGDRQGFPGLGDHRAGGAALAGSLATPTRPPAAEVVDLGWLAARGAAWDRLVARAVVATPFHSRRVIEAHAASGLAPADLAFAVVHEGGEFLAALAFRRRAAWFGWRRIGAAWLSPVMVDSTPLVARGHLERALDAMLDGLSGAADGGTWMLPLLGTANGVGEALRRAVARRGWPAAVLDPFERAVLDRRPGYDLYAGRHLGRSRRKGLRRLRARLSELGRVDFASFSGGDALARAIEDFLVLEARGWKGRRGTALASRGDTTALARRLFAAADGPVGGRADVLSLDGRPIAISLAVLCGGTAYLLKTAYDEELKKFAPGLVLEDAIIRALHDGGSCDRLDSASLPGCVLESLYADRVPMGDFVFAADPARDERRFAAMIALEAKRRRAVAGLKSLAARVRERG